MSNSPLKVGVIVGSVRTGRFAGTVADWFVGQARLREDMEIEVVDLCEPALVAELKLSLDAGERPEGEPGFAARIGAQDAYVVITPEYNHGYPASLKLAIDYVFGEWRAKPVSFVSYGGIAGGHRAVEQLRQVFAELHAVTLRDTVSFHNAWQQFDEAGALLDPEPAEKAATVLLDQLAWWGATLRDGRGARPYAA
ncbi:NAD(P)H-dependent oxidoreductase [Streptomyces roseirectus]|uniref:NAD(P)H-dependent oxidoreductase n=1 Tax=Streptomyces roseirectus TaxID=2768066 RepID=A0A7H0ICT7_9ACTN|nr:NAD(P)H-dependent oxidoreductase [Streptomyces roseirectus]QNP70603.1 NAD(P)H-dependent oxidoreductase [Streptomyces roseirectus]